jgi:hypothetical protein|tara:strand:+ start:351 stop:824 length:474 start_codon:yes stop_codon:yes gene_type:complete
MALTGTVKLYKSEVNEDTCVEKDIYHPDGSVTQETKCEYHDVLDETIENAYVIVRMAAIHMQDYNRFVEIVTEDNEIERVPIDIPRGETKADYYIHYRYNIYSDKEHRQDEYYFPLKEIDSDGMLNIQDLDLGGLNLYVFCYNHLKTQKGFEELTDI